MKSVFEAKNYKIWVREQLERNNGGKRGGWNRLADHLGVLPVVTSQIFSGGRDLSPEQAIEVAHYFQLDKAETEVFIALVHLARSGSHTLKQYWQGRLKELREQSQNLKSRTTQSGELTLEAKSIFYSDWTYSALSLAISVPALNTIDQLAAYFNLPRIRVKSIVEFLLQNGLCIEKSGLLMPSTKLDSVPIELRDFSSIMIAVDLEKLTEAKIIIREFRRKMLALFKTGHRKDVYQLAIQFYPMTKVKNTSSGRKIKRSRNEKQI